MGAPTPEAVRDLLYGTRPRRMVSMGVLCQLPPTRDDHLPKYLFAIPHRSEAMGILITTTSRTSLPGGDFLRRILTRITVRERDDIRSMTPEQLHDKYSDYHGVESSDPTVFMYPQEDKKLCSDPRGMRINWLTRIYTSGEIFQILDELDAASHVFLTETPVVVPKGRPDDRNEVPIACAQREFREETGLEPHDLYMHDMRAGYVSRAVGTNLREYTTCIYFARATPRIIAQVKSDNKILSSTQFRLTPETDSLVWLTLDEYRVRGRYTSGHAGICRAIRSYQRHTRCKPVSELDAVLHRYMKEAYLAHTPQPPTYYCKRRTIFGIEQYTPPIPS